MVRRHTPHPAAAATSRVFAVGRKHELGCAVPARHYVLCHVHCAVLWHLHIKGERIIT